MSDHHTEQPSMHIDPFEQAWITVSVLLLIAFAVAITIAGFASGIQLPTPEEQVNPQTVATSGPFSEPGLREVSEGKYDLYILAQMWRYTPKNTEVPVGSEVTIYITSIDVQHGFKIWDTNANMMVLPGQVSSVTVTFDEAGTYTFVCHEYCGASHATMAGSIIVVED